MTTSSNLLRDCEKLWWHRLMAVESMRGLALRSKQHIDAICGRLGVSPLDGPEDVGIVLDHMLSDLEMDPTEWNRQAVIWASRAPLEVYMCLLHAGVENCRALSRKHPEIAHQPLADFLDANPELEPRLRSVRDKILHPENEADYYGTLRELVGVAGSAAPDLYQALARLQDLLDGFLDGLREYLRHSVDGDVGRLPFPELLAFLRGTGATLRERAERAGAADAIAELDIFDLEQDRLEGLAASHLGRDDASVLRRTERVERLEASRQRLDSPRPREVRRGEVGDRHVPVDIRFASSVMLASAEFQDDVVQRYLPESVMRSRRGILELLIRSLVLYNESFVATMAKYRTVLPDTPLDQIMRDRALWEEAVRKSTPTEDGELIEQAMLLGGPHTIALALLARPLSVYAEITNSRPELRRSSFDHTDVDETVWLFQTLRSSVFHVPRSQTDMREALTLLQQHAVDQGQFLNIADGLICFYQGIEVPRDANTA